MARSSLTREEVLDAAAALVKRHGPQALTMRALAAELGTAVTSIYWHVGNRESLLDALVERTVQEMGTLRPAGRTPAARIVSVARGLRRQLRARPHLIAMVHERGLTERMFLPAQQALVHEVHAAGCAGRGRRQRCGRCSSRPSAFCSSNATGSGPPSSHPARAICGPRPPRTTTRRWPAHWLGPPTRTGCSRIPYGPWWKDC